ncbi:hypothetical protein MUK42_35809 [Musa troglodytarum]|uniref:Uncharacterized protein n=1 Tax=Musa troglodytarum TaxID=320322 RepID=A0A9E7FCC8_9LILI|nr:hypothetical protein MUK42_35809 [Musa troglodytarum]
MDLQSMYGGSTAVNILALHLDVSSPCLADPLGAVGLTVFLGASASLRGIFEGADTLLKSSQS